MAIIFLSFLLCCCFKKTGRKGNGCYERKANPVTSPLFPLEGNAAQQQRVYHTASRKDTLRKPDCQTAAFPPTGIY